MHANHQRPSTKAVYTRLAMRGQRRNSAGFTLIELSIVLVIVGILLFGVVKGQELIYNAKVKNLAQDFKQIPVLLYGYQDRFRAIPGDDAVATAHLSQASLASCSGCLGNGLINGNWDSTTTSDESYLFWQHVRLAGLAVGATDTSSSSYLPRNVEGGALGVEAVQNGYIGSNTTSDAGIQGQLLICSSSLSAKLARQLDATLDDGQSATGSMRAVDVASHSRGSAAASSWDDSKRYTVCMGV